MSKEEQLKQLVQEMYQESDRNFIPLFPWIFVRGISKEQVTKAGVVLPELEQNKTIHEGIVLATWKSKTIKRIPNEARSPDGSLKPQANLREDILESSLQPGDHVMFPHWAGMPIPGFSDRYRVIREYDWDESRNGGIFAKIAYQEQNVSKLRSLLMSEDGHWAIRSADTRDVDELVHAIEQQFLLVDRDAHSVTLSGR